MVATDTLPSRSICSVLVPLPSHPKTAAQWAPRQGALGELGVGELLRAADLREEERGDNDQPTTHRPNEVRAARPTTA